MHVRDRVAQTTNSSGNGNLETNGTIPGFKTFAGSVDAATDKTFAVLVKDGDAWELFESYLIDGSPDELFRGALIGSSAIDGSRINLSNTPNKPVYLVEPAECFGAMGWRSMFALTQGTQPNYTAILPVPIRALKNGTRCTICIHAINAASPVTFAPDGLTAKPVKFGRPARTIAPNRLVAGLFVDLEFSETDDCWLALSPIPNKVKTFSGTTYTILEEDHQQTVVFTSASGCAVTVPQSTGQFSAPFEWNYIVDAAAGTVTYTPTTSTINGGASLSASAMQSGAVRATGGNYVATALGARQATTTPALIGLSGKNDATTPNSLYGMTCPKLLLEDANGNTRVAALSATVDIAQAGISGLDTGSEANSTWYAFWGVDRTTPIVNAAVTADASTEKIALNAHGLPANTPVIFGGTSAPAGLTAGTTYYVKSPGTNDFQVAATPGGSAINITSTGTAVTVSTAPGLIVSVSATAPTLPSGSTFKQFLGGIFNDGSGNFLKTLIKDRSISFTSLVALNGVTVSAAGTFQSLSVSALIPAWARSISGKMGRTSTSSTNTITIEIAGGPDGEGAQPWASWNAAPATPVDGFNGGYGAFLKLILKVAQTLYWTATSTGDSIRMTINGFDW